MLCLGDEPLVDAGSVIGAMSQYVDVVVTTNDSRRGPAEQRTRVGRAGVPTHVPIVAAADAVVERLASLDCDRVFVVGMDGLRAHLEARGVTVVRDRTHPYDAVVTGCVPDLGALDPADVAALVGERPWLVTNADVTVPTPSGALPDTGAVIAHVGPAVGRLPEVCGKPSDWMTSATERVVGEIEHAVVIGDGIATDLAWARSRGWGSVLIGHDIGAARDADAVVARLRDCLV